MDIRNAMWLDHAIGVCRRIAERDLGVRVGNTQSIKHVIDEFVKMVERKHMRFTYWWDARQAFDTWFENVVEGLMSDEEILIEMYKLGELKERPHKTPTTKEEQDCRKRWADWCSWRIRQVLNDYGMGFETVININ